MSEVFGGAQNAVELAEEQKNNIKHKNKVTKRVFFCFTFILTFCFEAISGWKNG